jgi:conjugal transfer pilus assembly protein TraB
MMFKKILQLMKSTSRLDDDKLKKVVNTESLSLGGDRERNNLTRIKQIRLFIGLLIVVVIILGFLINYVQEKTIVEKPVVAPQTLKVELADKALDPDKMWRNHHEEALKAKTDELNKRIVQAEASVEETKNKFIEESRLQVESLKEQLKMAKAEMDEANRMLRGVAAREEERLNAEPLHKATAIEMQGFDNDTEFDMPKSAADYVPEGTYFTGYLLGGIVVSTALGAADENSTPVNIQLKGRGNLAKQNGLDISKCRIIGSAYGDLSSERAFIRLEKMVCEEDGMYITSEIAGDVHGPDGFNGIKGTVVSTGAKHIKNAAIGGLISGLAGSARGQEGINITSGGLVSTKSKGFKDMATGGLLSGASNAGEKIADYYLRQAESMSPVLTIPGGVRVNPQIIKGFFIGQVNTHRKIKAKRLTDKGNKRVEQHRQKEVLKANEQEEASDDGWK